MPEDRCPTCGSPVEVVGGEEGTSYFAPLAGRRPGAPGDGISVTSIQSPDGALELRVHVSRAALVRATREQASHLDEAIERLAYLLCQETPPPVPGSLRATS